MTKKKSEAKINIYPVLEMIGRGLLVLCFIDIMIQNLNAANGVAGRAFMLLLMMFMVGWIFLPVREYE